MRLKARFVGLAIGSVIALGVVTWSTPGHAEKVKTNQAAKLLSRAGEQAPVIMKVKAGQTMTVLAKDGRWVKVRVSGRTGWLPRSKVDMPDDDEDIARNTRRRPFVDGRGTKRGFGGEGGPEDRVGADAVGDDEAPKARGKASEDEDEDARPARKAPKRDDKSTKRQRQSRAEPSDDEDEDSPATEDRDSGKDDDAGELQDDLPRARVAKRTAILNEADKNSDEAFVAEGRYQLYVLAEKGKWTQVTNDEGDTGYVLTSKLEMEDGGGSSGPRKRVLDVRGRLGVALISQRVSTPGGMTALPDNYTASSSSITIAIGASAVYPYSKRYWVGGELAYDYDNAVLGGISHMGKTTTFALHNFNLRAMLGYDLKTSNGMIAFGRLSYHYDSFQIGDVASENNVAKIPNQIVSGPMLGAALAIPRFSKNLGLRVSLDAMLFASSVQQTKGLEDGTGPSAKAFYLGGIGTYRWKPRMDLHLTYDLAYTSIKFAGPAPAESTRGHTAMTTSSGRDLNHTLSFGVVYAF